MLFLMLYRRNRRRRGEGRRGNLSDQRESFKLVLKVVVKLELDSKCKENVEFSFICEEIKR